MLREMRDAAGENGEFYTPRPVVHFMVEVIDPRLGETVLDPACGTGGFLVEAYQHLEKQCQTVEDRRTLQERSLYGGEAKPLPYLLCQMNLLLHGLEAPQIDPAIASVSSSSEIGDKDRVDVILTNPPFGGEEEKGIKGNFPKRHANGGNGAAVPQLIMRKLRRGGHGAERPGRAAVVVPNGTLFGDGVCARIKEELLNEFNLHTIVRLPNGVFAPYTAFPPTCSSSTVAAQREEIWYYEQPLPEGRKNYTKTKPLQFEEFANLIAWWPRDKREENELAWRVRRSDVVQPAENGNGVSVNLDIKNPNAAQAAENLPPSSSSTTYSRKNARSLPLWRRSRPSWSTGRRTERWPEVALGDVLRRADRFEAKDELAEYEFAGTYSFARGIFRGETKTGSTFRLPIIQRVHAGDFIYCKIMAWEGAFGVAPPDVDGCVLSGAYVVYEIDATKLDPSYIDWYFKQRTVWESIGGRSTGTNVRRRSLHPDVFEAFQMPLPPIEEQRRAVAALDGVLIRLDRAMRLHDWVSSKPGTLVGAVVHDLIANREAAENSHASLGDFVVDAAYGTSERCDSDPTGIPVLRMGNIQDSEVLIRDLKYLPETAASPDLLRRGDILVNRTNSAELVGKCAVFDLEGNWTFASYLVRLRLDMSRANPLARCQHHQQSDWPSIRAP